MTTYRIGSVLVRPERSEFSTILEEAYKAHLHPFCMCKGEPGLPMHIAHIGDGYYIRRNPNTGGQHEVGCGSWEMPDEFSGRMDVASGINYDEGKAVLRLAFPLARQGSRGAPPPNECGSEDKLSVNNGGKKLSLQALLHMLWDEAGLSKWQGGGPDRKWDVVREHLLAAADEIVVKQHPLTHFLFIPEMWQRERTAELEASRRKRLIEFAVQQGKKGHQLMLLIGEKKKIGSASMGGFRASIKHIPEMSFLVNDELYARIKKHYAKEDIIVKATEESWSHQIVAATFSVTPEGTSEFEEVCFMPVNAQWIPFDNIYERDLLTKLIATKRSFTRPLRYNRLKNAVMPSVVLTDTGGGPSALYVIPPDQESDRVHNGSLEVDYNKWFWDTKDTAEMPAIPPRLEATEQEAEYLMAANAQVGESPAAKAAAAVPSMISPGHPQHPFLKSPTPTRMRPVNGPSKIPASAKAVSASAAPGQLSPTNRDFSGNDSQVAPKRKSPSVQRPANGEAGPAAQQASAAVNQPQSTTPVANQEQASDPQLPEPQKLPAAHEAVRVEPSVPARRSDGLHIHPLIRKSTASAPAILQR